LEQRAPTRAAPGSSAGAPGAPASSCTFSFSDWLCRKPESLRRAAEWGSRELCECESAPPFSGVQKSGVGVRFSVRVGAFLRTRVVPQNAARAFTRGFLFFLPRGAGGLAVVVRLSTWTVDGTEAMVSMGSVCS
jgi:hypothetical protein